MNSWVSNTLISVIKRRMFMSSLNSSFGELYILPKSRSILLGTFLLGDWEEIKLNRDLYILICWWKHSTNEKWFRRGCCLCIICQMCATCVCSLSNWVCFEKGAGLQVNILQEMSQYVPILMETSNLIIFSGKVVLSVQRSILSWHEWSIHWHSLVSVSASPAFL